MSTRPQLSIIVVTHNSWPDVQRCLKSIAITAAHLDPQVIVVDNHSSDDTARAIRDQFPTVELIESPTNDGYGVAVNRAAQHATGEFMMLLNPDAALRPGAADQLVRVARRPSTGVVGPLLLQADGNPQPSARRFPSSWRLLFEVSRLHRLLSRERRGDLLLGTYWDQSTTRRVDWVSGACHVFRRSLWDEVGPLTERTFCGFDDFEYCLRAADAGYATVHVATAIVDHGVGTSVSKRWSPLEVDQLAAHNMYVLLQEHWSRRRFRAYAFVEGLAALPRSRTQARLSFGIALGTAQPVVRCEPRPVGSPA